MEAMAKLAAVGVTAVVLSAVLRKNTPELALLLALAAGLWMLALTASGLGAVVELMNELAEQAGLSEVLLEPVVKTVALSILTRLTVEICRSAGEGGVAAFVETAGAVLALLAALPLITGWRAPTRPSSTEPPSRPSSGVCACARKPTVPAKPTCCPDW